MEKCFICDRKKEKERMIQATVNGQKTIMIEKVAVTPFICADHDVDPNITSFEVKPERR